MNAGYTEDALARSVMAFILTLRHTAGCSKGEIKLALHPRMIDMVFETDDARTVAEAHQ